MAYSFDNISIKKDGKRIFPIMGEIHYSRVPRDEWAERLLKMKAGGVTIVSAYVIWIHHEEIEGEYDWTGDRDLHGFVKTLKNCGMKMLLRIGPWCHGEARNGGFPDWLLHKDYEPRTNDEKYFAVVQKWYKEIYAQVKDFICNPEDASTSENPIIGVQIENEYGHCGGLYEKEGGEAHMHRLQNIAIETGFKVALYTATGWGGAWTGGMLPVMGGYCDAPWDQRITEIEPSGNYTFTHERNDHNIGSDHGFGYGITFDIKKFPYLTAELGGGLQVTSHRRTIATAKDIAAVALTKMGSGCNLLGFYMYSGGTNPEGKLSTLQESKATGYLNDLPVKSYDFRAPVREFGQVSQMLRELKLLAYFAADFGEDLCELKAEIPVEVKPDDFKTPRIAFRWKNGKTLEENAGYLFVNNYVRHQKLSKWSLNSVEGQGGFLPEITVNDGDFFFFPLNQTYGNSFVKKATVTPFTKIGDGEKEVFVFYKRENDESTANFFDFGESENGGFDTSTVLSNRKLNHRANFLVLSRADALNAWKIGERIFITDGDSAVIEGENNSIEVISRTNGAIFVYPDFEKVPNGWKKVSEENKNAASDLNVVPFAKYERENALAEKEDVGGKKEESSVERENAVVEPGRNHHDRTIEAKNEGEIYKLDLSDFAKILRSAQNDDSRQISDIFVKIDYTGESARLFVTKGGKRTLLLDHFYLGEDYPWEIGLKRFVQPASDCALSDEELSSIELEISPLKKDAKIYIEKWPEISGSEIASLKSVKFESEWKYKI